MLKELESFRVEFGAKPEDWSRKQWESVVEAVTAKPEGLLTIGDAANYIGHKFALSDSSIKALFEQMRLAVIRHCLTIRHHQTEQPFYHLHVKHDVDLVRADELDTWFKKEGMPYRIQPTETRSKAVTNEKTWNDAKLRALWDESLMPEVTHTSLAKKYNVSRQRIGTLLKQAKSKFSKMKSLSQLKNPYGQLIKN